MISLCLIFVSLTSGYAVGRWRERRNGGVEDSASLRLRHILQMLALFGGIPLAAMLSLWGLRRPELRLLTLPLLGLMAWSVGGMMALVLARLLRMDRAATGSYFCCGAFTNIGAVGSLVCLMWLGESSIALTALYRLCEEMFYFGVAMPVARHFGTGDPALFARPYRSPLLYAVLVALALGVVLNVSGVRRPEFLGTVASALVMAATVFFLFSIGLGLRLSRLRCYIPESLGMCAVKFLLVPVCIVGAARILGLQHMDDGLALKTVTILSTMPVAMNALIPPSLFRLDLDLANACWVFSTLALVVVLPVVDVLLPLL
ncbi:MAG: AEC family transporter [Desulfovibrio sp.]|nr:AEC family transporter [Desulfovibrio sp.]